MRTTLNLPDALAEAARARAADEGRTLTSLVEEGLRRVLDDRLPPSARVELPVSSVAGRLLVDLDDAEALAAALDADGPR